MIFRSQNVRIHVLRKALDAFRVIDVKLQMFRVVVIALKNSGGMSAKRLVDDGFNSMRGNDGLFRVSLDVFRGNKFFRDDNHSLAGFRLLFIFPTGTMNLRIALMIGDLHMNERNIGIEGF